MTRDVRISLGLVALFAAVVAALALTRGGDEESADRAPVSTSSAQAPQGSTAEPPTPVVRKTDARRLGVEGSTGVTFTEFLDFECEACGAAFPVIEQLREQYKGKVTFVLRYFPIESHRNAMNAAVAVESAYQQGKLEAMYARMYETQTEWGEQQTSQAKLFRGFAKDLGLDLKQYDADVKRASTEQRVREDVEAGSALGVQGTPTFFINEELIEPESFADLQAKLEAAIAAS